MERELQRIATPTARHRSWVATDGETIRATATLAWSSHGPPEVGVLVEDVWFRRGLGRALCAEIAAEASHAGVPTVVARIQGDNHRAARFVHALASHAPSRVSGGELTVLVSVPVATADDG